MQNHLKRCHLSSWRAACWLSEDLFVILMTVIIAEWSVPEKIVMIMWWSRLIGGCCWGELKFWFMAFSSVQFSCSVVSNSLRPRRLQQARLPYPSPTPRACSNSYPLSQWCHPSISSSVIPFSSRPQSFPASGSFQMSQFFTSGGQRTGASASTSVLPMNLQDWSPLGWTGWISLQAKGLSRVFPNTTVQKHQFFSTQLSL